MNLLIVDPDPLSLKTLSSLTESWGFIPACAQDGESAWEIIEKNAPPLILVNRSMPQLNGMDLCARIGEKIPKSKMPYIIMVTTPDCGEDLETGLALGVNEYITTPYHKTELKTRLNTGKRIILLQGELLASRKCREVLMPNDDLTGAYNRRAFNESLKKEWARALRTSEKVSIALIHIDHLKTFNERYGKPTGDKCLRVIAHEIARTVKRSTDFIARYDDEKFALILPLTSDLPLILEACRLAIETLQIEHKDSELGILTVSIGGATVTPKNTPVNAEKLLYVADQELSKAKQNGVNSISIIPLD